MSNYIFIDYLDKKSDFNDSYKASLEAQGYSPPTIEFYRRTTFSPTNDYREDKWVVIAKSDMPVI